MVLGPMTNELFNQFIEEIKKEEFQEKIHTFLVDPVIEYMRCKLFSYLQFLGILISIIILLLLIILIILIRK